MKSIRFVIPLLISLTTALRAVAETHAVLIGVSDYYHLDADLKGPANDVVLMAQTLQDRGVPAQNIHVLAAEGVSTTAGTIIGRPERAAILNAIKSAATRVQAGDDFVLYFSGHGSQAPDQNGDEAGGFDEILLPADTAKWSGATKQVPGAIVDDEWHALLQPILDKGARVTGIIDACHSSTGFRALQTSASRYVDPTTLNIPDADPQEATSQPMLNGDYVFLYSAQSDERAFEYPLGDAENAANWHGDFTVNLARVLAQGDPTSWREALAATKNAMRTNGPAPQTPAGEGPMLDQALFGTAKTDRRIALEDGILQAGKIHGVLAGATYQVGDQTVSVTKVNALTSDIKATAPLPKLAFAKLLSKPAQTGITVSLDGIAEPTQATIRDMGLDGITFGTDADFYLVETQSGLALGPTPDGPFGSPLNGTDDIADALGRALHLSRFRATLADLSAQTAVGFALPTSQLLVGLSKRTATPDCTDYASQEAAPEPLRAQHCDQLWFTLHNPSQTPRDVTVLYVDQDLGITPIWPYDGLSNRIRFGETQDIGLQIENPDQRPSLENVIVIAVPASAGNLETDLSYLADVDAGQSRTIRQTEMTNWFDAQMDPTASTRGFDLNPPNVMIFRYSIELKERL